ncbi:MAG: hypothetical protein ACTIJ9_10570 [Aequorivita sp.]
MKLIQPLAKTLLFMLLISTVFISCNNKNDAPSDDKKEKVTDNKRKKATDDKKKKVADPDHTIDITLTQGQETIEFSETKPSTEGGAKYSEQKALTGQNGDRKRTISMNLGNSYKRGATGGVINGYFIVDENWKPFTHIKQGDKKISSLWISPEGKGDYYDAISGTLTFSDLKFALTTSQHGAARYTLNFECDFQKNGKKRDIFHGSGTIVMSPKHQVGVYKEK